MRIHIIYKIFKVRFRSRFMCEYRLPFAANIDRLKSGISIARVRANIECATRTFFMNTV